MKTIPLRRPDACVVCGTSLQTGTRAVWDPTARTVTCLLCPIAGEQPAAVAPARDVLPSMEPSDRQATSPAGASALAEYERRSQRRSQAIRSQHPRLGGLILALSSEPSSTRVWAQGARGERAVGTKVDGLAGEHLQVLHDRRSLREDGRASRGNIDHVAVAASGVWVIDAKTHQGRLEVRRSGGLLSPRTEKLCIAGRDRSGLLEGLQKQVEVVQRVLSEVEALVPVRGALCFVGTELPWFGESVGGVPLVGTRGLAKLLKADGDLGPDDRAAIATYLDTRFVPA